ncbi:hypothetical protein CKM354_001122000 [Cercospora kikuchii]|uniref:Uncharacterized protein n=1 Tax=Cercospora kikuchii TaxID=84275 RepID=A0A9P3CRV9_9PEZI|nr:uncharacterized protein CKM354_001122000 [Cercospora kikuchii]GIZ48147.1 hypothetical protein CKM354_001122000 [Cercospora kikuchii]
MSSIQPPWTMARQKLVNSHLDDTTAPNESDWQLDHASASEVAELFEDLSAFVYKGYCTGNLMIDLPIFKTMKHLSNRLYSYAFSLVVEKSVNFLTRPGQSTTLSTTTAAQSMGQLAAFLQRKAHDLDTCGLSSGTENSLASDLRFAKEYTTSLLESKVYGDGLAHPLPVRQDHPASQTPIIGAARPIPESSDGKATMVQTASEQASAPPAPICQPEVGEVRNGEHAKLLQTLLHTNSVPNCTNCRTGEPASFNVDLDTPSQAVSTSANGSTTPVERSHPRTLRPASLNTHHAPTTLSGPRLQSHIGLDDYDAFVEHCFTSAKTLGSDADPCTTAQIGHSTNELFQPHQFIDIAVLGFEGIKAVKLVHPLCPREVECLSFDVLRYIDYVLSESDAVHSLTWTKDASEKSVLARCAEKQSLSMVEKELATRKWELHRERPKETNAAAQTCQAVTRERHAILNGAVWAGKASGCLAQMSDAEAASSQGVPEQSLSDNFTRHSTNQESLPKSCIDDEELSVEHLRAQLAALGIESKGPASLDDDAMTSTHMPKSALQGPKSDIQGPHEEFCECRVKLDRFNESLRPPKPSTNPSSKIPRSITVEGEKHVSIADPPPLIVYTEAQTGDRYAVDDANRQPRSINELHGSSPASTSVPPPRLRSSRGRKQTGEENDSCLGVERLLVNGCSTTSRRDFEAEVLDRFLARNA